MNSDLLCLNAHFEELNELLCGARIDKIQQPEIDELRFFVRNKGKNMCLVLSANPNSPRIHITEFKRQNPIVAYNFLMLLRKHLNSAYIDSIETFNKDRIAKITITASTEMRDTTTYFIFFEIMNKFSNIIFCDSNLKILDLVKQTSITDKHFVAKGAKYKCQQSNKTSFLDFEKSIFDNYNGEPIGDVLSANLSGLSKVTIIEILHRCRLEWSSQDLSASDINLLANLLSQLKDIRNQNFYQPNIFANEVFPMRYTSKNCPDTPQICDSLNSAFDRVNTEIDSSIRHSNRIKSILKSANSLVKKAEKNIEVSKTKIDEALGKDEFKIIGELITSNIYKIKRGDKTLDCINYYTNQEVEIALDPQLSPSRNAENYFKRYNKLKKQELFFAEKLKKDLINLDYVVSIKDSISLLELDDDIKNIEQEIKALQHKTSSQKKVRKEKKTPLTQYKIGDFSVYVGKNNAENEEVTFSIANSNDTWMHIKNGHGMHLIIKNHGESVPDSVLKICAEITASSEHSSVEIDYCDRRHVGRMPKGNLGQVVYTNFKTIVATPDKHLEYKI